MNKNSNFENNVYSLIAELKHFDYVIEGSDRIWNMIFPHTKTARKSFLLLSPRSAVSGCLLYQPN